MLKHLSVLVWGMAFVLNVAHAGTVSFEQWIAFANKAEETGNWKQAETYYTNARWERPADEHATAGLSRTWTALGRADEAEKMVKTYLKETNPFSIEAHLQMAVLSHKKGDLTESVKELDTVDKLRPNYGPAVVERASVYVEQNQNEKAVDLLNQFIKNNPSHLNAKFQRGMAYNKLQRYDSAIADLKWFVAEKPNHEQANLQLASAWFKKRDPRESEKVLRTYLVLEPKSTQAAQQLAEVLEDQKKLDEALQVLKSATTVNPEHSEVGYRLAKIYIKKDQRKMAEDELARVLRNDPKYDLAAQEVVSLWTSQGQTDKAGVYLKNYCEKFPHKLWAVKHYAKLLIDINQKESAVEVVENSLDKQELNVDWAVLGSWAYSQAGDYKKALDVLKDANKKFPHDHAVHFETGTVYEKMGNFPAAISEFSSIADNSPQSAAAKAKVSQLKEKLEGNRKVSSETK